MPIALAEAVRKALSSTPKSSISDASLVPAGVMLLLYRKEGESWALLSRRSQTVARHTGEIAFPGGVEERSDPTRLDTALRETFEEIGV
ncbi:MAG: NUDIX domain-containing protein, partial [SAR202 cluster bacterium]|nr:NUDIX domain-containing protein [SAR202 cluster bacterium]